MKILLCTFGSHGDVHPYLALGRELPVRNHEVMLATTSNFREPALQPLTVDGFSSGTAPPKNASWTNSIACRRMTRSRV